MTEDRNTEAGSLDPREVGERFRLSFQRLAAADFPAYYWRVAGAAWALTFSFQKAWDSTYVQVIAKTARIHRNRASEALRDLAEIDVIQWEPSGYGRARSW